MLELGSTTHSSTYLTMYLISFFICFVNSGGLGASLTAEESETSISQFKPGNNQHRPFNKEEWRNRGQISPWVGWGRTGIFVRSLKTPH